jgi:hypothetical protein
MPIAGGNSDKGAKSKFRIRIDKSSMLPQFRTSGVDEFTFSEDAPENLTLSKAANYTEDNITGRSEPYLSYGYSLGTKINFTGKLVARGEPKDRNIPMEILGGGLGLTGRFVSGASQFIGIAGKTTSAGFNALYPGESKPNEIATITFQEVTQKVAWLEALTYPQYDAQGVAYPPPRVWLQYGANFNRRGLVTDVNFTFHGPWEVTSMLCMYVECNIGFIEINKSPKGYLDVRSITQPEFSPTPTTGFGVQSAIDNARSIAGL